jgi:hypothetical protein
MKSRVDRLLRDEAARYSLRFACEDCAHFDATRARCSLGYPAEPRRDALACAQDLAFCKDFDLA